MSRASTSTRAPRNYLVASTDQDFISLENMQLLTEADALATIADLLMNGAKPTDLHLAKLVDFATTPITRPTITLA